MAKRQCAGTTKAGNPCKANAILNTEHCNAHASKELKASLGFGGVQPGGGRPKNPRAVDVLRQRIEDEIDAVLDPLFDALRADRGLALAVKGGGMEIGYSPDHPTRITAARELLDRAYGRPKQTTELTGPNGDGIRFDMPLDVDDKSTRAARLLAQNGLVPLAVTTNGNGNGSNGHHN